MPSSFAAVLFAAACHAGWNAAIKRGLDPLATTVLISIGAALVSAVFLPVVGLPAARSMALVRRVGADPSRLFRGADRELPRRRHGAGLSDRPRLGAADDRDRDDAASSASGSACSRWRGIILLAAGVLLLSLRGGRDLARLDRKAVGFALFTAVTICAYSVVDGMGARLAGSANAYSAALFVGIGPVMVIYALARRGREVIPPMAAALGHRPCGWRAAARLLRHRDLGDDGGADRDRGGAARDQRAVRRGDRRGLPQGAAAGKPRRRGADDRRRADVDPAVLNERHLSVAHLLRRESDPAIRSRAVARDPPARSTSHNVTGSCQVKPSAPRRRRVFVHHACDVPQGMSRNSAGLGARSADQHIAAVLGRDQHRVGACAQHVCGRAQMPGVNAGQSVPMTRAGPLRRRAPPACGRRDRRRAGAPSARAKRAARSRKEGWLWSGVAHSVTGPMSAAMAVATARSIRRACNVGGAGLAEHRNQPGLGKARNWRLGEDRDGDRLIHNRIAAPAPPDPPRKNRRAAGATSATMVLSTPFFSQRRPEVTTRSRRHSGRPTA